MMRADERPGTNGALQSLSGDSPDGLGLGRLGWAGGIITGVESGRIGGLSPEELDLGATLRSGQVFRWTPDAANNAWCGVVGARRRARLAQSGDGSVLFWEADGPDAEAAVRDFLRLGDLNLAAQAETWCAADAFFAASWARQPGVRVLRQDPHECFFSFLCASVAPIARISGMLRAVAGRFGDALEPWGDVPLWAFPRAGQLADADEATLRDLGLGFRAKRVAEAAHTVATLPGDWLGALRGQPAGVCKKELTTGFFGVGEKIADCVALFSLDVDDAIPVDTHIWRIAVSRYVPDLSGRSLTPAAYARVGAAFRERFGPFAGWAQQSLFYRVAVKN
jgi:N-glycosylase/DNA lyase